ATVRFLEVLNADHRLDSSILQTSGTATDSWSGLDHLNGQTTKVIGDSFILEDEQPSAGAITSAESVNELEVGLSFLVRIKSLPLSVAIQGQSWAGEYFNPVQANVRVYESRDFIVKNGTQTVKPILQEFAQNYIPADATLYTKWLKVYIGGVGRETQIEITQEEPLDLNVLAIHYGVRVS
ncbi:MAG: hypothetical protein HRU20_16385, partial [Pseudomonadales bacterium]|nr:hypothetical protein [Pseudomonadales bacterium]